MSRARTHVAQRTAGATAFYARVTQEESAELSIPNQVKRFDELAEEHDWDSRRFVEPRAAHGDSSWDLTGNRTVKVLMGDAEIDWAMATTSEESTPPDKNAPTGTSAISWSDIAAVNICSTVSTTSLSWQASS